MEQSTLWIRFLEEPFLVKLLRRVATVLRIRPITMCVLIVWKFLEIRPDLKILKRPDPALFLIWCAFLLHT